MAGLQCFGCGQEFGFFRRERGCKKCGRLFCSGCTSNSLVLPGHGPKKVKVCDQCFRNAARKQEKQSQNADIDNMNDLNRDAASLRSEFNNPQRYIPQSGSVRANIPSSVSEDENVSTDPDDAIRRRLAELRSDDACSSIDTPSPKPTDEELGNRFENLTGRKATSMQNPDVNAFLVPKKSEVEQVDDLMKQMEEENKLDENSATSGNRITDKEIEERLNRLKDLDPSLTNQPKASEFDSDEDDEAASKRYLQQILGEVALELKTDGIDIGESRKRMDSSKTKPSKSPTPGRSKPTVNTSPGTSDKLSSIFSKDYEADSDDDELPWCCICNGNAVLRCHGCDDDLYCRRCYREGHNREDYEDHDISEYRPPRKKH